MKKARLLAGVTALFMCGISFSPAMAQASSLLGLSSSTLPLSDVGEGTEGGDRVVNLTIS